MHAQDEFDREAAERILRRAVRLDDPGHQLGDGVSERALVEAADELGVDRRTVLRAVSEERLGLLTRRGARIDRLVGAATVTATRLVDGSAETVLEQLDAWLRRTGSLRRQRLGATYAEYTRRSDVAASLQRTVRSLTGEEDLRRVSRLRVDVRPVEQDRSLVALVADLRTERQLALAGGGGIAGLGSLTSVLLSFDSTVALIGVPVSVAAGAGILVARASGLSDVEADLAGVLDRVATGEKPPGVLGDVGRRLLGSRPRSPRTADR